MNDEQVTAILGMVLMTQPEQEVRVPYELIEKGLPENSGVQVEQDDASNELVIRIKSFDDSEGN